MLGIIRPGKQVSRIGFGSLPFSSDLCSVQVRLIRFGSIQFGSNSRMLFYFILSIDMILAKIMSVRFGLVCV